MNKFINNIRQALSLGIVAMSAMFIATTNVSAQPKMKTTGFTTQPIGHFEYCMKNRRDCSIRARSNRPMKLTRQKWDELIRINSRVNAAIKPVTDQEYFGRQEKWVLPVNHGDCEDYALLKRKILMSKGWPASTLLITVVRQRNGDGHAILTVRTDRGDFILDNLKGNVKPWYQSKYTFLKRQAVSHSGKWERIADKRSPRTFASVK